MILTCFYTQIFKSSSTFVLPLLERKVPANGPRLQEYAETAPELRNLYVILTDTTAIVYIELDGRCTMHAGLSLKKENSLVSKVLMNNSNTEFSLGMTDGIVLGNYVIVVSRRDANGEPFCMKGEALTKDNLCD